MLSLVVVAALSAQATYEVALRHAQALVEEGRIDEALDAVESLVASTPGRAEAYFVLGDLYRRQWRPQDAVEVFSEALVATEGSAAELHREIAATFAELRAWDVALEHLETSLELAPSHPPSLFAKAMVLAQRGDRAQALKLYQGLVRDEPRSATLHFRIGEIEESVNRVDAAEERFRRAIELDPDLQGVRFRLGKLLLASGRTREAERELARAVRLSPEHAESHLELANALDALSRTAKARHHYETAIVLDPNLAPAYLAYGNFSVRQGEPERGQALLARFQELTRLEQTTADLFAAVDFAPDDTDAKRELVSFLVEHERYPLALRMAQRFLLTDASAEAHHLLVATVYRAWGRERDAERTLERARAAFPDSEAIRGELQEHTPR